MSFHIECRRWFQKSVGNTYHSVYIFKDGECIGKVPYEYGYGTHCLQTAFEWLCSEDFIYNVKRNNNGTLEKPLWQYFQSIQASTSIIDVARKQDL